MAVTGPQGQGRPAEAQKQYWLRRVREALTQLQIQYVKPITDLTEAVENLLNAIEQARMIEQREMMERMKKQDEKGKSPKPS
jgi:LPS sulfotransferase NodH